MQRIVTTVLVRVGVRRCGSLVIAAFAPPWQAPARVVGLASVATFLLNAWPERGYGAASLVG